MAKAEKIGHDTYIELSKKEAVEIIALLTGQLANLPVPGNYSGAAPTIKVVDGGVIVEKITLFVEHVSPETAARLARNTTE